MRGGDVFGGVTHREDAFDAAIAAGQDATYFVGRALSGQLEELLAKGGREGYHQHTLVRQMTAEGARVVNSF